MGNRVDFWERRSYAPVGWAEGRAAELAARQHVERVRATLRGSYEPNPLTGAGDSTAAEDTEALAARVLGRRVAALAREIGAERLRAAARIAAAIAGRRHGGYVLAEAILAERW